MLRFLMAAVVAVPLLAACGSPGDGAGAARQALEEGRGVWALRGHTALEVQDHVRLVFHGGLGRVVLASSRPSRGVWAWNGSTWARTTPSFTEMFSQSAAYHAGLGGLVVFGGRSDDGSSPEVSSETWLVEGSEVRTLGAGPSSRSGAGMAYDAARDQAVLVGGRTRSLAPSDETWLLDAEGHWTLASPETPAPASVPERAMAYDAVRERVVMVHATFGEDTETWEWDGTNWAFVETTTALPERCACALVWDPERQRILTVAGEQILAYDGADWTPLAAAPPPSGALAYDEARGRLMAFGGSRTFEHDGDEWVEAEPTAPLLRSSAGMTYDTRRERTVLFGATFSDPYLWEWDGERWSRGTEGVPEGHWMAGTYDSGRSRVVGASDDWELWEEDGEAWHNVTPAGQSTGRVVIAYDEARGVVVGNTYAGETWTWNGATLTDTMDESAPGVRLAALAYDARREVLVRFGGYTDGSAASRTDDTWEWDGDGWTLAEPLARPPSRGGHVMAYDERRGVVVLFGGYSRSDTWEYDGTTWVHRPTNEGPLGELPGGMTYDPRRDRVVLLASDGGLWEYYTVGGPCSQAEDCASGYCVEGVCCDRACPSQCGVCTVASGASEDGVCELFDDAPATCEEDEADDGDDDARSGRGGRCSVSTGPGTTHGPMPPLAVLLLLLAGATGRFMRRRRSGHLRDRLGRV